MQVHAWSNGAHRASGAGYGLRITRHDRDHYFDSGWATIVIHVDSTQQMTVALSQSFWTDCTELRSAQIGRWLLTHGHARWPTGHPPRLELHHVYSNHFRLAGPALPG